MVGYDINWRANAGDAILLHPQYLKYSNKTLQSLVDSVSDIQNDLSLAEMPSRKSRDSGILVMAIAFYDISGADMMPKAKPTQVVVHRIELQDKERECLKRLYWEQELREQPKPPYWEWLLSGLVWLVILLIGH